MKKAVLCVILIILVFFALFKWRGGSEGLVGAVIPTFPDFPTPATQLSEQQSGEIFFASSTPFDMDVILNDPNVGLPSTGVGTLFLPDDASAAKPVPAMIVLHGSGGISPGREMDYGRFLKDNGYAALVVNYYAPRGITDDTPYMMRILSVTEFDAMADAYSALKLLSTHPAINASRVGVMGFSYGGMATRFAMDERFREKLAPGLPGFAAFVDYYGPCFQNIGTRKTNGNPLLTLRGTEDASNDLAACKLREEELRTLGVEIQAHIFEGAGHAWEIQSPRSLRKSSPYVAGCEINYNSQGYSMVEGEFIVNTPTDTSREKRIAIRMSSGITMNRCVKLGYIIGNDPVTKEKSDKLLLAFLSKTLKPDQR
jgi:dienelactone hydrolase